MNTQDTFTLKQAISMLWTTIYRVLYTVDTTAKAGAHLAEYAEMEADAITKEARIENAANLKRLESLNAE